MARRRKAAMVSAAVFSLALLAAGCGSTSTAKATKTTANTKTTAARIAHTLVFGLSSEPPDIDPQVNTGSAAQDVKTQLYRGLFIFGPHGTVHKELLSSYKEVSPTEYTFTLRSGLKFSNGQALTAADVVFSFKRIEDPSVGAYLAKDLSVIQSVKAEGSHSVKMTLKHPDAPLLSILAMPQAAIVSKSFTLAHGNSLKTAALGEGPYKLKNWQHGVQLTVVKNPDYYGAPNLPKTPEIDFKFYADDSTRVNALESGAVDMIEYVPWQDIVSIKQNPQLGYQGTEGPFMYLIYNLKRKPFNSPLVRQAVGYAINREQILKDAFYGRGAPIYGLPIPKASFAYHSSIQHSYTYDTKKAKALLKQAGYPNCFHATLLSTSQYGMHKDTAEVVAQDLNSLGCHIKLQLPDWATRVSIGNQGNYDFAVMGTAGNYNDPDFLSAFFKSGPTYFASAPGYDDPKMNALLQQGRETLSQSKRSAIYLQIEKLAIKDSPYTFLSWREQGYAYKKNVTGFVNMPGFLTFYSPYTLQDTVLKK